MFSLKSMNMFNIKKYGMKTYLKIMLIGMCVIAFACISYHRNHQKKFDNLFFENVEALANNEQGQEWICIGDGDVDCPIGETKSLWVVERCR